MTVRDALNRGYNLAGTAMVSIIGIGFFQEFFFEDEVAHKLDEGVLLLLAIGAVAWYFIGDNKFSRTIVPLLFTGGALIMKLLALFLLEAADAADIGDEYGTLLLLVLTLGFLIWQYVSLGRMEEREVVGAGGK